MPTRPSFFSFNGKNYFLENGFKTFFILHNIKNWTTMICRITFKNGDDSGLQMIAIAIKMKVTSKIMIYIAGENIFYSSIKKKTKEVW